MSDKNGEECWYALKVFYNRVFELEKQLSQEGVRSYIPLLHEDTVAGDKKIRKRKPAVSSLMFIRQSEHYLLELQDRMKASCPFMAYFDRETKKPAVIPDREMELFMQITSADTSDWNISATKRSTTVPATRSGSRAARSREPRGTSSGSGATAAWSSLWKASSP